ncbi:hypothetical protein QAD02_010631 [Eretmocerus hayati]|uniref:Uncharacterized protein n=1 Tax=Eretmocerus hayati TaxID=131215 RepID=A0ACC2NUB0_9HYME|nr:hypothetical protein QAD02_010631 [Eretmocerus hayati]
MNTMGEDNGEFNLADLPKLSQIGLLSTLEECDDLLSVYLRSLNGHPTTTSCMRDIVQSCLPLRNMRNGAVFEKEGQAAFELAEQEEIFEKLRQDTLCLKKLICSAKDSLATNGHMKEFINEVELMVATRNSEDDLLTRAREMEVKLLSMQNELLRMREENVKKEEGLRNELLRLENEKERLKVKWGAELDYVRRWLDSRREQLELVTKSSREELLARLHCCQLREEHERVVTNRIEAFLRQSAEENERAEQNFMKRRQEEVCIFEMEVHRLGECIRASQKVLDELRLKYDERQKFIEECLAEKEAARKRLEWEEHRKSCAVKIQAWWRGVMVRKKLGPYRPDDKKKRRTANKNKK